MDENKPKKGTIPDYIQMLNYIIVILILLADIGKNKHAEETFFRD